MQHINQPKEDTEHKAHQQLQCRKKINEKEYKAY